jgi:hypothetical protein
MARIFEGSEPSYCPGVAWIRLVETAVNLVVLGLAWMVQAI